MRIYSWNLNGIRSAATQGLLKWLSDESPDIVCFQELKANREDVDQLILSPFGYQSFWHSAEKKGYSGVAIYSRRRPDDISLGLGVKAFDREGRVIAAQFGDLIVVSAYFPNSQRDHARLGFKIDFCEAIAEYVDKLVSSKKSVVLCGDFNIAHQEIDLKNPHSNRNNAGFLPEERAWMSRFLGKGYVDSFRSACPEPGHYSWWSYRPGVREKNIGWRLDYHVLSPNLRSRIQRAEIHPDVLGSDHCPVSVELSD
ncbi:MAG: exodeoxyribonuclease III [Oligoflexia bacterium]|nr:exodeoxyribonuclease III [Oligoflexia bacterium]